jgi:Mrp family chromosome partitioning ATPase
VLARRDLEALFVELRRRFEWVLVDSPPVGSVTDALLLARHADIVLFVVQHDRVDKKEVRRALASLRKVTPNLLGGVFNGIEAGSRPGYYDYYYAHHPPAAGEAADAEPAETVGAGKASKD